jgi:LmbE family N-acetylglucosaminyl deacetylase
MNPYDAFVSDYSKLILSGKKLPLGNLELREDARRPKPDAPVALIFGPHPDDECITGALPLRLLREAGMRVVIIAVTLGSNPARRAARWGEMARACQWIGFDFETAAPGGLENIHPKARAESGERWAAAVGAIAALIVKYHPRAVFFPHELDANSTHQGTHWLLMDALRALPSAYECAVIETEFWAPMSTPNLMIESRLRDVADLVSALSLHVGEVERNPYHLRLPAWMIDNVRRGAELVGTQGAAAPNFLFATLYRAKKWKNGRMEPAFVGSRKIGIADHVLSAIE